MVDFGETPIPERDPHSQDREQKELREVRKLGEMLNTIRLRVFATGDATENSIFPDKKLVEIARRLERSFVHVKADTYAGMARGLDMFTDAFMGTPLPVLHTVRAVTPLHEKNRTTLVDIFEQLSDILKHADRHPEAVPKAMAIIQQNLTAFRTVPRYARAPLSSDVRELEEASAAEDALRVIEEGLIAITDTFAD